jgi:hypothetical protein
LARQNIGGYQILAATKYWCRQNIGADRNVCVDRKYMLQQKIGVDKMLASTKCWHQENTRIDKILPSTKFLRQQSSHVDKNLASTKCWHRRRSISLLFGSAESTAADFSQTMLMISYVSQKVLIPPHAVAKCGFVSGHPAFMGNSLPHCTGLFYRPAMQKTSQILASTFAKL